jgi:hypothetical protein
MPKVERGFFSVGRIFLHAAQHSHHPPPDGLSLPFPEPVTADAGGGGRGAPPPSSTTSIGSSPSSSFPPPALPSPPLPASASGHTSGARRTRARPPDTVGEPSSSAPGGEAASKQPSPLSRLTSPSVPSSSGAAPAGRRTPPGPGLSGAGDRSNSSSRSTYSSFSASSRKPGAKAAQFSREARPHKKTSPEMAAMLASSPLPCGRHAAPSAQSRGGPCRTRSAAAEVSAGQMKTACSSRD